MGLRLWDVGLGFVGVEVGRTGRTGSHSQFIIHHSSFIMIPVIIVNAMLLMIVYDSV
jgi:hypothetical protein